MKKRYIGLDYLKVLAILMVLSIHVHLFSIDFIQSGKAFNLFQYALRLISEGVPLFVITNGFLMFRKERIEYGKFYRKTFGYFLLYLLFGALTILIVNSGKDMTLNAFLTELLQISSGKPYTGSLWFIQNLIAVYLIFPVLHYVYRNSYPLFTGLLKITAFFSIGLNTAKLIAEIFLRIDADKFSSLSSLDAAFGSFSPFSISVFLLFFLLGGYVDRNLEKIVPRLKTLWLLSVLAWFVSLGYAVIMSRMTVSLLQPDFNYGSVFMTVQVITVFVTFLQIREKGGFADKTASYIASCSLWIYFVHNILIYLLLYRLSYASLKDRLIYLAVVFVLSLAIASLIRLFTKRIFKRSGDTAGANRKTG